MRGTDTYLYLRLGRRVYKIYEAGTGGRVKKSVLYYVAG